MIGCGHLGRIHCRVLAGIEGVRLAAVADIDPARTAEIRTAYGVDAFPDAAALKLPLDLAVVAVPTRDHHAVVSLLLDRGVPVLVEKPMCRTLAEAEDLVARSRKSGAPLMVGHVERFNPAILAIRNFDLDPRFVEAHRVSPFTFRSSDVSVVLDMMIHDIDIILDLVKSEVAEVSAVGVPVLSGGEDIANARLVFENGAVATATASRVSLKRERTIRIFSPDSYVTLDYMQKKGRIFRKGPALLKGFDPAAVDLASITDPVEFMTRDLIRVEEIEMGSVEPLVAEDTAFVEAVRSGTPPPVTGQDGLRAMRTVIAIEERIRESLASLVRGR